MKEVRMMVREHREAMGVTQTFIAKKIGIKPSRLSALENGTHRLTADEFLKICIYGFDITPQNFFDLHFHQSENLKLKSTV